MKGYKVEIKEVNRRGKERNHQIIVDSEVKETLIDEYIGYVNQVAKEYQFYGMRKKEWLEKNVRSEDRWKY